MLSDHVPHRRSRQRLQEVIAVSHLDDFTDWLASLRYSKATIRSYVFSAVRFADWARANDYRDLSDLGQRCLTAYRMHLIRIRGSVKRAYANGNSYCGARTFVRFLRQLGIIPAKASDVPPLVMRFCQWMRNHRGSRETTLANYRHVLCKMLQRLGGEPRLYTAPQLRAFVLAEARGFSHSKAETTVTAVRMFVRFLIAHRECQDALQHAIPRMGKWGQASLPRYIAPEAVERVVDACKANTPLGSRDRAVLLLLARLGLRAGEVANLRLDDLDWTQGRIRVTGKSRQSAWLPLPQDAGDAVLHYLTAVRPRVPTDRVFLIIRAPYSPILARQISGTAERTIRRSGISAPSLGAHVFRHSAATAWLRQGLSLQSIGAILRHRDVDTTAIYAKVDVGLLRQIAMPWPGEHAPC
jgi:integrase/recombinase XerD